MKSLLLLTLCTLLKYTGAVCYNGSSSSLCSTCGGSCTGENGCLCTDGSFNFCVPVSTECQMDDNTCCAILEGWYWDKTSACCTETLQCNDPPCGIDEECVLIDNNPTCVCNKSMYSGITPLDLKPTVKCDTAMVASVSMCQIEKLGYNYSSLVLANDTNNCTYTYPDFINNIQVESIQVKPAIGWCGNIVVKDSSKIYFVNTAYIYQNTGPLITKNPIVFNFSCEYNLTMQSSLNFSLSPILSTIVIPSPNPGTGSFIVTMAAYTDSQFTDPIQEGDEILVGTNIYLALFAQYLDASSFVLRVENCFAAPTNDSNGSSNVQFVSGGCAISDAISTAILENGKSSEARIQTTAFLFQDSTDLYISCDVKICDKTTKCDQCNSGRAARDSSSELSIRLNLQGLDYMNNSGDHAVASWTMLVASLLGLLSVKFF